MLSINLLYTARWLQTCSAISASQLAVLAAGLEAYAADAAAMERMTVPAAARVTTPEPGSNVVDFAAVKRDRSRS